MDIELVISNTPIEVTIENTGQELQVSTETVEVLLNNALPASISDVPDVLINNLQDGDTLVFDVSNSLWRNVPPAGLTGDIAGGTFF